MGHRHQQLRTLSLVSLLAGCGSGPALPITYETKHLRIGTDLENPLCAGDLVAFEKTIERVEDELGFSMKKKFSVSIWSSDAWEKVKEDYCDHRVSLGCTSYAETSIYTSWGVVQHELVHAAIPIEDLTPFFAEGLADAYGGRQSRFALTAPADSLVLSGTDMDRPAATHFVRWLRETWGGAKLGELARLGKHADDRFAEVYGMSFADAQAMYFAEAPFGYASIDTCGGAPLDFADALGGWQARIAFDCDNGEQVRVYGIGMMVPRTFIIPVAGYYSVITDADGLTLSRCATGPIVEPVRYDEFDGDDVPPSYANSLSEVSALYEGGSALDLHFESGKHEIGLLLLGYGVGEANLSIRPSLGPRPVPLEGGH